MYSGERSLLLARKKSLMSAERNFAFLVDYTLLKNSLIRIKSAASVLVS